MSVLDTVFKLYWCQIIASPFLPMMRLKLDNGNKIIFVNEKDGKFFGFLLEPDGNFGALRMPSHTNHQAWSYNLQESVYEFDLDDPSTVTGLRDLLREACGDPSIHAQPSLVEIDGEGNHNVVRWMAMTAFATQFPVSSHGKTEGEAYASALRKRLEVAIAGAERKPLPWEEVSQKE